MKIHFISYGNAFRSRLAEAYLKYLFRRKQDIEITSSGIRLEDPINGPITWYTMKVLTQHELIPYMSMEQHKTSKELISEQDYIIFMDGISYDFCCKHFGFSNKWGIEYEVWHINYIPPNKPIDYFGDMSEDLVIIKRAEDIFSYIKENCNRFIENQFSYDAPLR